MEPCLPGEPRLARIKARVIERRIGNKLTQRLAHVILLYLLSPSHAPDQVARSVPPTFPVVPSSSYESMMQLFRQGITDFTWCSLAPRPGSKPADLNKGLISCDATSRASRLMLS
ncbi:uncharacterized protein PSANT_04516 [Moesziomyces antarcticus]|uniref:Uncharacterized protein n=1 Tax=Pseudozyma antarctica TaxID=84753 RepID=A0A5C3FRM3_PSEA2|nr:uncharacterized protein PSANT_04516 [Moesziomyces antarcticus]